MTTATASTPRRPVPTVVRGWRSWPARITALWQRSLRFRTILITLALTAVTVLVAFIWMALAIQNELFQSRLRQALSSAQRATVAAQTELDAAVDTDDPVTAQNLMNSVLRTLSQQSAADAFASYRIDTDASSLAPQNIDSVGFDPAIVTPELRELVRSNVDTQWWQSVQLTTEAGQGPGLLVGQQLVVQGVGPYELYLAYNLEGASATLAFVQVTLWIAGLALVALIGGITWFVLRSVTVPIGEAAETSAQLAAGDLGVRLPVRGDDELAVLGRSFNAMADSIESQIKELADLSLVQQRFVSDVSHELRTPLTTIRLAADMINDQRESFDPATARAAELLYAQVQRFESLLTDLLEISRYDAGSVQLELEPTSLAHLAEDVIGSLHQLAEQHGSDVRLLAPGGHSLVEMDARRVRRIVRNLLGNAIEHGEGRPIVVTVDSDQNAVALGVRDYGMGMRPGEAEHVFDRFWRADPSRTRTIGGSGLGLSIALGDARLHGGRLEVWSELGRGSHFVLTLPRRGGQLAGPSPITLDVDDDSASLEAMGLTQPIDLARGAS
ncbi:HAMP domain-containing histidine kinase [Microbacterium sp. dk485]|uniref:MtrAB system histidine kinase MtrB n=1 Tax=Microbacterium sp. dk485 TaxID=2560021 RepID=UPI00107421CD|nr:MtrAB system histidine kinase MtrB [Microbacterium sp. dk485]TFV83751.1 HAMP domain-containing histidine kinase [Microbacterium sp. dk485]